MRSCLCWTWADTAGTPWPHRTEAVCVVLGRLAAVRRGLATAACSVLMSASVSALPQNSMA